MYEQYTPDEYVAEIRRQTEEAASLAQGLDPAALNWQSEGGKSWSVGQCLDHLVRANTAGLAAMRSAVESNRDQLEIRRGPMQAAGWFSRWFISFIGPDPKRKVPAPKKTVPASQVLPEVLGEFEVAQVSVGNFVSEFREAALGRVRYKNPLVPVRWTIDTGLLIILAHNQRHLQQAKRVRQNERFAR